MLKREIHRHEAFQILVTFGQTTQKEARCVNGMQAERSVILFKMMEKLTTFATPLSLSSQFLLKSSY
jgi:hypothetical protein